MSKERFIDAIRNRTPKNTKTIAKIQKQKKLSRKEFLTNYDCLWQNGPAVKYQNIGSKEMIPRAINQNPTLW